MGQLRRGLERVKHTGHPSQFELQFLSLGHKPIYGHMNSQTEQPYRAPVVDAISPLIVRKYGPDLNLNFELFG